MDYSEVQQRWLSRYLEEKEKRLLQMYFSDKLNPKSFAEVSGQADVEDNRNYMLLLSQMCFTYGWDSVPDRIQTRMKGVFRYFQTQNALMMGYLSHLLPKFRENGIEVLLLGGTAMRTVYDPQKVRMISNLDIAVKEKDISATRKLVFNLGGKFCGLSDLTETYDLNGTRVHLYNRIFPGGGKFGSDILEKTGEAEVFGGKVRVLSPLDMFIHLLDTYTRDLFSCESPKISISRLYDAEIVWEKAGRPEISIIRSRAEELGCLYRLDFSLMLFIDCFSDAGPVRKQDEVYFTDTGYRNWVIEMTNVSGRLETHILKQDQIKQKGIADIIYRLNRKALAFRCFSTYSTGKGRNHISRLWLFLGDCVENRIKKFFIIREYKSFGKK